MGRPNIVWCKLVPEPYGSDYGWKREDMIRYAEGFRPAGYKGGIEDEDAYLQWRNEEMYKIIVQDFDKITADNWVAAGCPW